MLEEELKNTVASDFFSKFDCRKILSKIDFSVCMSGSSAIGDQYFLWAEAKAKRYDEYEMLTQLVLTIGKARTFDDILPPPFLGCFDTEKIVFIPYSEIQGIFYINDFNWNVTSSDNSTKEFTLLKQKIVDIVVKGGEKSQPLCFNFSNDERELRTFIKENFVVGNTAINKIHIDKNNFIIIYNKWLEQVKPTIMINWDSAKKHGIIGGDFYLADLLSRNNESLKDMLYVYLKQTQYIFNRYEDKELGTFKSDTAFFSDGQKAHKEFWAKYERPPLEEYWEYIIDRRDLLVPQDIREIKGSFYTPQKWVKLSQLYLADVFGVNWQDEYTIWDCAAGTGNLLVGLSNKYNIWASTVDEQDVNVMQDLIENNANLLKSHVFAFDFLNDDFALLPPDLKRIIDNEPEKLIIYINPPYAQGSDMKVLKGKKAKGGVEQSATNQKYGKYLRQGNSELFAQFLTRIYFEIPGCKIAEFSKTKTLNGQHFTDFRQFFLAKLVQAFVCPASSFDNVKGDFPIGFKIWDTGQKEPFKEITADVYEGDGSFKCKKRICSFIDSNYINDWVKPYRGSKDSDNIGKFAFQGNVFQHQRMVAIVSVKMDYINDAGHFLINADNLVIACIYYAVRKVIPADWLNDRDQFLYPNEGWMHDKEFQNDCLTYTLFSNQIQSKYGANHWIPFTEYEVNAQNKFESHFMTDFIAGKRKVSPENITQTGLLFEEKSVGLESYGQTPLVFSDIATAVFSAGRELWRYYHSQKDCNVNASFYDIREYFQGRNEAGRMNSKSDDEMYNKLIGELRQVMKLLGEKIKPKVYEYGFLL